MIAAIVQARMSSRRLPGKVLAELGGRPALGWLLDRLARCTRIDGVTVATSDERGDDVLAEWCRARGVDVHRGPLDDVAARVLAAARERRLDGVVRISGDSPLMDPALVDRAAERLRAGEADLVSNVVPPRTYPAGQSVEAVRTDSLAAAVPLMTEPGDREHVTPALYRHPDRFRIEALRHAPSLGDRRMVLDTDDDLCALEALARRMRRPQAEYGLAELVRLWDRAA